MKAAAVLLAAGRSTRFGRADKILAPLNGIALGLHAAHTLTNVSLSARWVVTGKSSCDWPGFTPVVNEMPERGLASSLSIGVGAARAFGAEAVLIALADMPFVPVSHFNELIGRVAGPASIIASIAGKQHMPPAVFGADWFSVFESLTGDEGARHLLKSGVAVPATSAQLFDVNWPIDLKVAQALSNDLPQLEVKA